MIERGDRFLLLFALANAGGVVAYAPFLTLLLPAKIAGLAGGAHVEWMAAAILAGAVAASIGNIAFGWLSDIAGSRRMWAGAGLCLTVASYALLHTAQSKAALIGSVVLYQLVLNMLLAPLAAWAADTVPDRRKGLLGGLLGAGPLVGGLAGVAATAPMLTESWTRMVAVCAMVLMFTLPLLLSRAAPYPDSPDCRSDGPPRKAATTSFALLWAARLLVQVAGNALFGFLFYYFQSLPDAPTEAIVARLAALALLIAFPAALAFGGLSDRLERRKPFLLASLAVATAGLAIMAVAQELALSATGYILFGCGSTVFLALQTSYAMQLLPSASRRGRDLGVMNLTNTLPALIAPALALWLVPGRGFGPFLAVLAGLLLLAGCVTALVRYNPERAAPQRPLETR